MLCCAGLIGGVVVGQYLGGPWTVVAPAAGFAIGLAADMKFMKGCHMGASGHPHESRPEATPGAAQVPRMEAAERKVQRHEEKPDQPAGKRQEAELAHH